jgi:uncharacterized BrkB/YihY/UPF0761 family membrane protein
LAWTTLQAIGGYIVSHQLQGASDTYGTFAIVIGLLAWIYLGAQVTLVAAEMNVVRKRRLWPRAIVQPPSPKPTNGPSGATRARSAKAGEDVNVRIDETTSAPNDTHPP